MTNVIAGTWLYILAGHEDEAVDAIIKARPHLPLDAKVLRGMVEAYKPYLYTDATKDKPFGTQAEADWARTIKAMETADVLPKGTKPADYFTNDLIDPAYFQTIAR